MIFDQGAHQGVANFVICDEALAPTIGQGLPFHTGNDAVHRIIDFAQGGGLLPAPSRQDGRLIQQVGQISSGKARRPSGDHLKADVFGQLFIA